MHRGRWARIGGWGCDGQGRHACAHDIVRIAEALIMSGDNASLVLVHGAWADGSSWAKIVAAMATEARRIVAAPLPLSSFADDVAALDRALERVPGPVVLAGHAYAGAVIAAVRSAKVRALVYVAAIAPDEGETAADVFYRTDPHPAAPRLAPDAHGLIYLPDEAFPAAFAQNATAEELAVLRATQRPIAPACLTAPMPRPLWKDVPGWFLVAQHDRMIVEQNQRFMAGRMQARIHARAVDHTPLVTAPDAVLAVLREAIAAVPA
jgi:pimeloyl-ACP methyl ester carboxylesterase